MRYRYRNDEELKDSGVEWIGKIPKDWSLIKLKYISHLKSGEYISKDEYDDNGKYNIYGSNGVIGKSNKINNVKKNIIIGRVGACGEVNIATEGWISDNALILDVVSKNYNFNYVVYSLNSMNLKELASGTAQPLITGTQVKNLSLVNLDKNVQIKIANFLDEKTSQFNLIISKKEKLIERLEEAKKSLISEVVTGKVKVVKTDAGYDLVKRSSNEMKDSGVEWLGEIPKDWKVSKLKWYLRVKSGEFISNIKKEFGEDANIPVIGGNGVMGYSNKVNINEKVLAVGRVGALCGNVHLIDYNCWITDNSLIIYLNSSEIYLEYLLKVLKVLNLNSLSTSTAQPLITGETIKTRKFCLPTLREQKEIINFLDKKILQYESIISKNKVLIKKLKEAKQSLISEAVTGKIDILD